MAYFDQCFIDFFKKLSKNNNTGWFNDNRKSYEQDVKKPFAAFVEEMIRRISKLEPGIEIKYGDGMKDNS